MKTSHLTWKVSEALRLAPFPLAIAHIKLHLHSWAHSLTVVGRDLHHNARLQKKTDHIIYILIVNKTLYTIFIQL